MELKKRLENLDESSTRLNDEEELAETFCQHWHDRLMIMMNIILLTSGYTHICMSLKKILLAGLLLVLKWACYSSP